MTRRRLVARTIALMVAIAILTGARAAGAAITLEPVLSGLSSPLLATNARDGSNRLFVVEQGGVIKVLQPGAEAPTVFLDIGASKVLAGGEQGLLGLAFHPQFTTNRRFFVNYTRQSDGATVIAEYLVSVGDPNVADPLSETVFLVIPQPFANHNGGMVEFGPDGFLYIGMGDGGSGNDPGNRAQNITDLLGKMLRIDVDTPNGPTPYSSPPSNPFFGATPGADEIYAIGLRNPFRFSFDRATGDLYAGDVGQGAREEIDIITLGGNYGWRIWEGTSCTGNDPGLCNPAGFVFPIAEYSHAAGRCAVVGGYVYRGTQGSLPLGSYVYGDFCTGEIFQILNDTSSMALDTGINITSFGEDQAGELYVVGSGTVQRIVAVTIPGAPTIGAATAGNAQALVAFTPPASTGGSPITGYTATSSPSGITGSGAGSPITVSGLVNGTAYTFTVTATNAVGTGPASAASNSVTPVTVPGAPIIGAATTAGNLRASVAFTPPADTGGSPITGYTATSSPSGITGASANSPITVSGLVNGTSYTFTVTATSAVGTSPASAASNSIMPTPSFVDVPTGHVFLLWIEALVRAGFTGGCDTDPPAFCPDQPVTRATMAVFLLRGIHGAGYTPPPASGIFADVAATDALAAWVERLLAEGVTGGCAVNPPRYCPDQSVTRGQMAVLLLRAKHGPDYQPPAATGVFVDVPIDHPFARWIEDLASEGITGGCGSNPARYCPDRSVTRGQMAVFLVRAFDLPI